MGYSPVTCVIIIVAETMTEKSIPVLKSQMARRWAI